jgi:hypothetical protein
MNDPDTCPNGVFAGRAWEVVAAEAGTATARAVTVAASRLVMVVLRRIYWLLSPDL